MLVRMQQCSTRGAAVYSLEIVPETPFEEEYLREFVPDPVSQERFAVLHPLASGRCVVQVRTGQLD